MVKKNFISYFKPNGNLNVIINASDITSDCADDRGNKCTWPRLKYVTLLLFSIFEYNDFNKNVYSNDEVICNNTILPSSLKSIIED